MNYLKKTKTDLPIRTKLKKKTVSEKQNNKTTYTSWAKAAERNRSSRL